MCSLCPRLPIVWAHGVVRTCFSVFHLTARTCTVNPWPALQCVVFYFVYFFLFTSLLPPDLMWSPDHLAPFTPPLSSESALMPLATTRFFPFAMHLMISQCLDRFTHTCPPRQNESGVTVPLVLRTAWVKQQQTTISTQFREHSPGFLCRYADMAPRCITLCTA